MSKLGDFLERFYSPVETFRTVRARVRHTKRSAPPRVDPSRRPIGRRRTDLTDQEEAVDELLMWGAPPHRVRLDETRTAEGRTARSIEVVSGDEVWKRYSNGTVERQGIRKIRGHSRHSLPTRYLVEH